MHKILHPKLVILSYAFAPSVGGIETVSQILAKSFVQRGYEVTVITNTACGNVESAEPFHIVRQPSIKTLVSQIYRTDIVLQCHISLRIAWPMWFMFIRKPFILTLHTQIASPNRAAMWLGRLKHIFLLRPRCLFVSNYLAETIKPGACAIWNPYDNSVFRLLPGVVRSRDLIFVGRLVFAKGVDILLRAFALVLKYRPSTSLSVVGSGQEENNLQKLACTLGIEQNTDFLGIRKGNELASLMNQHKIIVVPSRSQPPEALSVVPIEGTACGCVPVASKQGGLPESVGDGGILFEEGNIDELATVLFRLLKSQKLLDYFCAQGRSHIAKFHPDKIIDAYEACFNEALYK